MVEWDTTLSFQSVCDILNQKHDKPGAIAGACRVVEDCLISNKDNLRGFFENCFPLLIKRIFGYDDKEASWLQIAVDARDEDATALIQLLAPTGPLFSALHAADGDQLIQFLFPPERLPAHTQELLRLPAGRLELDGWPQYRGRLRLDGGGRCQVHLNMFQYFMFWAAFYVLRAGRSSTDKNGQGNGSSSRSRTFIPPGARKLWTAGYATASDTAGIARHPYFRLLRMYLEHYLPRPAGVSPVGQAGSRAGFGSRASGGGSSRGAGLAGLGASSGAAFAGQPAASAGPGEVLLSVLLEFWLTDAGEPLPAEPPSPNSRAGSPTGQLLPVVGTAAAAVGPNGMPLAGSGGSIAAAAAAAAGVGGWGAAQAGGTGMGGMVAQPGVLGADTLLHQQSFMMAGTGAAGPGSLSGANVAGGAGLSLAGSDRMMAMGLSSSGAGAAGTLHTYSYQPPADELVQALSLLMKYVFVGEPASPDQQPVPAQAGTKWLPVSPVATLPLPAGRLALPHQAAAMMASPAFSPAAQAVSRKLYRLLRRTFQQWQPSSSASLDNIVKLWLVVLTPWKAATFNDTKDLQASIELLTQRGARSASRSGSTTAGLGSTAGAVLRGAAGSAAGFVSSGGGNVARHSTSDGGGHSLFGGAGQVAANLNRWGSEVVHRMGTSQAGAEFDQGDRRAQGLERSQLYNLSWRSHVLAHLPFYTILLPAFLELAYSQMAYSPKVAHKAVHRVLRHLAESGRDLIAELKQAEAAYTRYISSSIRRPEGDLAELLPWLADQAADWEQAAAGGAPTTPPLNTDTRYRLFNLDHGGAPSCMRALLAAIDRQNMSGRDRTRALAEVVLPLSELPSEAAAAAIDTAAGRDYPKAGTWRELRYHGDWMMRPIASNEIAPLVRLLVAISRMVNSAFGLTGVPTPDVEPPATTLQEIPAVFRRRGWRVNLRPLAEVQMLAWLIGLVLLGRWLWVLFTSEGSLFGLDDDYYRDVGTAAAGQYGTAGQPPVYQHRQTWQQRP